MAARTIGWWTGRKPARGMYTKRDARFCPDGMMRVADNMELEGIAVARRNGFKRRNDTGFTNTCLHHNGTTHYTSWRDHSSLAMGTSFCIEVGCHFQDALPAADVTVLWKGNSTDAPIRYWYDQAAAVFKATVETASQTIILVGTTTPAVNTKYYLTVDRSGDTIDFYVNGASEDTDTFVGGSGESLKTVTGRLMAMGRANTASGDIAGDQFVRGKWGHLRVWSSNRGSSNISANHNKELATSDNTNLAHYWRGYAGSDRKVVYDSVDHITTRANRVNGRTRPCSRPLVDRHWPENATAAWDAATPGIAEGERWAEFDGIEQSDAFSPVASQEQLFSTQRSSKHQWCVRGEFLPLVTGAIGTITDWTAGTGKHLMVEMLANSTIRAESRWGSAQRLVTTVATVTAGTPYVYHVCRDDQDFSISLHRKDTQAAVGATITTASASSGAGEAVTGNDATRGSTTAAANFFPGGIGPVTMFDEAVGEISIDTLPVGRMNHSRLHLSGRAVGKDLVEMGASLAVTPNCVPTDPDDDDGPPLGECITGIAPTKRGFGSFLYDYKRASSDPQRPGEVLRHVLMGYGGSIFRAPNVEDSSGSWAQFVFKEIATGRKVTRTTLATLARFRDDLAIFDGVNRNLMYSRKDEVTKLGLDKPATACSAASGGVGLLDGDYDYYIVFRDPSTGHRSSRSPVASITGLSLEDVDLTSIPLSTDTTRTTIYRDIYRTKYGNGGKSEQVYLVATLFDNTTTTLSGENDADTTLVPSNRLDTEDGFDVGDVVPISRYGITYQSRLWAFGDPAVPTRVRYSQIGNIQGYAAHHFLDLSDYGSGDPLTGGAVLYDRLFLFTENSIWEVKARGAPENFSLDRICDYVGAAGHHGIVKAVIGPYQTLLFWNAGDQRLYSFDGQGGPREASDPIDATVEGYTQRVLPYATGIYYHKKRVAIWALSEGSVDNTLEGDQGYPENDKFLYAWVGVSMGAQGVEWSVNFTEGNPGDVNTMAIIEDPVTRENKPFGIDYLGYVREYDNGTMDGSGVTGDVYGTCSAGWTTSTGSLLDEAGNTAALYTTNDALRGLYMTVEFTDGTEESKRIETNTASAITLNEVFSQAPASGNVWRVGQIAGKVKFPQIDFASNQTEKALSWFMLFHKLETGLTQGAATTARLAVECYQDGSATSVPAVRTLDLTTGDPTTSPDKRVEVGETGRTHSVQFYGPHPREPFQIEGINFEIDMWGLDEPGST